jgi:GT2 family glycosyltransferase
MAAAEPFFSIIVPTYRRPAQLAVCLEAMTQLDYPANRFEVIVVDDGSNAPPEATVTAVQDRLDVTLLTVPHGGPAAARNAGAERAKGDVLAFTDDDCAPTAIWLRAFADRFGPNRDCATGGQTLNALSENLYSSASQLLIDYLYVYYNAESAQARFFTSNNLAVPADGFREVGGFDVTFPLPAAEDREFCDRWVHRGHRLVYAPDAVIRHAHSLTMRRFWRQHFDYGRGAFHFHRLRAVRSHHRMRVEPAAFYTGLLLHPLSRAPRRHALPLVALTVLSQVANAAGFLAAKRAAARARTNLI